MWRDEKYSSNIKLIFYDNLIPTISHSPKNGVVGKQVNIIVLLRAPICWNHKTAIGNTLPRTMFLTYIANQHDMSNEQDYRLDRNALRHIKP